MTSGIRHTVLPYPEIQVSYSGRASTILKGEPLNDSSLLLAEAQDLHIESKEFPSVGKERSSRGQCSQNVKVIMEMPPEQAIPHASVLGLVGDTCGLEAKMNLQSWTGFSILPADAANFRPGCLHANPVEMPSKDKGFLNLSLAPDRRK